MSTTRTIEPTQITTNDTVEWTRVFSDFPADEWTLAYYFRGPGEGFNIDAEQDADDPEKFDVTIDPADTEDVDTAGAYTWEAWVTNIADPTITKLAASGRVQIAIGFDADSTDAIETRTHAQIMLDAIDAALLVAGDEIEYTISTPAGSRRRVRSTRADALEARKYWANMVNLEKTRERIRNGGTFGKRVGVRFTD